MKDYSKPAADEIEEIVRLSMLYDFYGPLLTDRNRQIFEDYIVNDMSLSEIADDIGIILLSVDNHSFLYNSFKSLWR